LAAAPRGLQSIPPARIRPTVWMLNNEQLGELRIDMEMTRSRTARLAALILCAGTIMATPVNARDFPWPDRKQPAAFTIWGADSEENEIAPPDFPAPSAVVFDSANRPWILCTDEADEHFYSLSVLRDDGWEHFDLEELLRPLVPDLRISNINCIFDLGYMGIDRDDRIYAMVPVWKENERRGAKGHDTPPAYALVATADGGQSFSRALLPTWTIPAPNITSTWTVSFVQGDNSARRPNHPPAVANWFFLEPFQGFASVHRLSVYLPEWKNGELILGDPIEISDRALGMVSHSGSECLASVGDRVFLAYLAFPDDDPLVDRTILRVAEIDRTTRGIVRDIVVEDPVKDMGRIHADIHPSPAIATDAEGFLHIISGSHNEPFRYFRSKAAGTLEAGITEPEILAGRQSYPSFNISPNGSFGLAYRIVPALWFSSRPVGEKTWTPSKKLIQTPPFYGKYTAFYHTLQHDRRGGLFLTFTLFDHHKERGWVQGHYPRAMIHSVDGGQTWQQTTTKILAERIEDRQ